MTETLFSQFMQHWNAHQSESPEQQLKLAYQQLLDMPKASEQYRALKYIEERVEQDPQIYQEAYDRNPALRVKAVLLALEQERWAKWMSAYVDAHPVITHSLWESLSPQQQTELKSILKTAQIELQAAAHKSAGRDGTDSLLDQAISRFLKNLT